MGDEKCQDGFAILTVNPGSTSTKLSLFRDLDLVAESELAKTCKIGMGCDEFEATVKEYIAEIETFLKTQDGICLDAVVGRGGFIDRRKSRVQGGVYWIARKIDGKTEILNDIVRGVVENPELEHACNLGIPIAAELAKAHNVAAFTVDPVVADDFPDVARVSGYAGIERKSLAHVLSVKAMGRKAAAQLEKPLEDTRLVVTHMGGGITVAALREGKLVDNNLALLGGGPFTPQRAGALPLKGVIDLCYSGQYTKAEIVKELGKKGGLISYLGEDDARVIEARIRKGDEEARLVMEAMAYQIAKEIGAMSIAVGGDVDGLVFSGGLAKSEMFLGMLRPWVAHLAPMIVFVDNVEMEAMAAGALRVLRGEEDARIYNLIRD